MSNIIELARQAGGTPYTNRHYHGETAMAFGPVALERFVSLIRADEREACAKVCDVTPPYPFRPSIEAAHAIRAREQA